MDISDTLNNILNIAVYSIVFVVIISAVISLIASWRQRVIEKHLAFKLTFLQIRLPNDNEIETKSAEHMFSNLMGFRIGFWETLLSGQQRISFEIVGKSDGIGFYVAAPDDIAPLVEKQINAAYPSAEIDIVNPEEIWDRGEYTAVAELKLKGPSYYPIKVYEDLKNDSLSSITNTMSKMEEGQVLAVQYVIQPAPDSWRYVGRGFINRIKQKTASSEGKGGVDTAFLENVEKKISHPGFYTKVRIVAIDKDKFSAQNNVKSMLSAFEQFTDVSYNRFVRRSGLGNFYVKVIDDFIFRRIRIRDITVPLMGIQLYTNTPILNTVELATVFHFPNKDTGTPKIMWLTARRSSAPANIPEKGLHLGKSIFRGVEKDIYMKEEDRARHLYIVGQTGTGKSQLMMYLIKQDIRNGEGVAVIDPHGTDIDALLQCIPPEREKDVILFDAADTERPIGLNLLEAASEDEKHMVVNAFIALLYKLYDPNKQGIMGPQLERAIRNVMLTAMADPESTMVDVLRLLIDSKYAQKFINKLNDPMVKRYWTDEMAKTSDYHKSEKMGYFVSKFDRFVTEKLMRNILGQPHSALNFPKIMAEKKILLVDLAKGKIGEENSNFLGLLLVPRILAAALGRHKFIGKQEFPNFFLYVDEFQNFATPDFATILSEARKYKLNLVVGHQFVAQLDDDIKNAIFGNVGTMTIFRVGSEDAEFLEPYFEPTFTKNDLASLPIGNAYVRLLVDGQPTAPFSMKVDWNVISSVPKFPGAPERIREASRMKYGTPIEEVETYINTRAGFDEPPQQDPSLPPNPFKPASKLPF
jgi:DNA helicase HerA-like ATPase